MTPLLLTSTLSKSHIKDDLESYKWKLGRRRVPCAYSPSYPSPPLALIPTVNPGLIIARGKRGKEYEHENVSTWYMSTSLTFHCHAYQSHERIERAIGGHDNYFWKVRQAVSVQEMSIPGFLSSLHLEYHLLTTAWMYTCHGNLPL